MKAPVVDGPLRIKGEQSLQIRTPRYQIFNFLRVDMVLRGEGGNYPHTVFLELTKALTMSARP
jgi:hypothetical protein